MPGRHDLDPLDIPKLLTHLWLSDVEHEPLRFRFRLVGSAIVKGVGRELTGTYFDECFEDFAGSSPHNTLVDVCGKGTPIWNRAPALITRPGYNVKQIERIFLPLAADGETVDMVMGLSVYVQTD